MKTITILGIIIFFAVIGFVFWLIARKGKQNTLDANEYNRRYILIDTLIDTSSADKLEYDFISQLMEGFRLMKYKDTARTIKLIDKFNAKFEPEASKIIKEHENNNNYEYNDMDKAGKM